MPRKTNPPRRKGTQSKSQPARSARPSQKAQSSASTDFKTAAMQGGTVQRGRSGNPSVDVPTINLTQKKKFHLVWHSAAAPTGYVYISYKEMKNRLANQYLFKTVGILGTASPLATSMFDKLQFIRAQAWGPQASDTAGFSLNKISRASIAPPSCVYFDSATGEGDRATAVVHGDELDWSVADGVDNVLQIAGASILHVTILAWSA
jgi:hypothetical protein